MQCFEKKKHFLKGLESHVWSDNKQTIRLRCVTFTIKQINHKIMLKHILERVVKTGFWGVLSFFSCIVMRSPSY